MRMKYDKNNPYYSLLLLGPRIIFRIIVEHYKRTALSFVILLVTSDQTSIKEGNV